MERDTFFPRNGRLPDDGAPLDPADPKGNLLGHFDVSQIPPGDEGRMVAAGLKGVFLKWLIDEKFGAAHHRLLFIEYLPGVAIGAHDHTYEEAYFILSGEVEAVMDGKRYVATAGHRALDRHRLRPHVQEHQQRAGAVAGDVLAAATAGERLPLHGGVGAEGERARG